MPKQYDVEVQSDFLERQTKAQPIVAVAELIWNGLDADAMNVTVDLPLDPLGGLAKIVVTDNGHGIPFADAPTLFKNLGGSWKRHGGQTQQKRWLHGQEGKGRFKALALGNVVEWKTVYLKEGIPHGYTITVLESDIRHLRISDEKPLKTASPGTMVVITELKHLWASDRDLTTVLKVHRARLDPDIVIDDPVKVTPPTIREFVSLIRARPWTKDCQTQ